MIGIRVYDMYSVFYVDLVWGLPYSVHQIYKEIGEPEDIIVGIVNERRELRVLDFVARRRRVGSYGIVYKVPGIIALVVVVAKG